MIKLKGTAGSKVRINAEAKINLSLDVLRKRIDSYHDVEMIMQSVALHDIVEIEATTGCSIEIICNHTGVPSDASGNPETNIAWKAADAILRKAGIRKSEGIVSGTRTVAEADARAGTRPDKRATGVRIFITKHIPVASGLGGGSSDAAAVLKGINLLFSLGYDYNCLTTLASGIGADVPFCLSGGTAYAEGIGDRITPLPAFRKSFDIVLVKPLIEVSTAWVYGKLDPGKLPAGSRPDTTALIRAIAKSEIGIIAAGMKNVLETVTVSEYPVIGKIKDCLIQYGALGSMMSGSGPTVFGIFKDKDTAMHAYKELSKEKAFECILTHTAAGSGKMLYNIG